VANIEFDKLLLSNLEAINKKLDDLQDDFKNLPCGDRLVRIDRLEQQQIQRKENKALIWGGFFAALGAFGLSLWNWMTKQ
jgi:hypothetical protein